MLTTPLSEPKRPRFRSGRTIEQDFRYLTGTVQDIARKPHLRPAIASHLHILGHRRDHIESFLAGFYGDDLPSNPDTQEDNCAD